jgi:polyhydroxybutyrate depolymerase
MAALSAVAKVTRGRASSGSRAGASWWPYFPCNRWWDDQTVPLPTAYRPLTFACHDAAMRTRGPALLLVVAVLVALTGCRRDEAPSTVDRPPAGTSTQHLTVDGVVRDFRLFVPSSLAGSASLVVMLHGGFGTAEQAEESYGWDDEAERRGFAVAYPDGINRAWSVGGGCCGEPGRNGTDDVGFIVAVVANVAGRLPIDAGRVYATGMSNGALMSYRLACDTNVFAAVAPVAGTLLGSCPAPKPVSLLHIHGLADENIPFDGSPGAGFAKVDGPDVPSTVDIWRAVDRCQPPTVQAADPVSTSRAACADGREVILITIAGAGHQWPGGKDRTVAERALGLDPPSTAFNATAAIWSFFAAHTRQ